MRWMIGFALALSLAATTARADDASRLKLAHEVVETAHSADTMRALLPTFMAQMRMIIGQKSGSDAKRVDTYVERFQAKFKDGIPAFVDLVAEVYAREFSEEDLSNLLAFYRTPTGQDFLGKQAAIAQSMILVGQQWGKGIAQQVLSDMEKDKAAAPSPKL